MVAVSPASASSSMPWPCGSARSPYGSWIRAGSGAPTRPRITRQAVRAPGIGVACSTGAA